MKVFWSWQSDTPHKNNHFFVRDALKLALKQVAADLDLTEAERPEVDHDTKGEPGMVSIVDTIFDKIDKAALFVADLTFVGQSPEGKMLPNPNVMIELGYAIKTLGPSRIILVSNAAFGARPEDLPFDLRHRRKPIPFNLPALATNDDRKVAQRNLISVLTPVLVDILSLVREQSATKIEYPAAPTRLDDRSTWLAAGERIRHLGYFHDGGKAELEVEEQSRYYLRLIPASYKGVKSAREVHDLRIPRLHPWIHGDGGVNPLGAVAVGWTDSKVNSATQWFKDTGELWAFNCSATFSRNDVPLVAWGDIARNWRLYLDEALALMGKIGVTGPLMAEAGVTGFKDALWPDLGYRRHATLSDEVYFRQAERAWSPETREQFLTSAFNQLAQAYNQPELTVANFLQIK